MNIWLTNTFLKSKTLFLHDKKNPIKLYVCGITPYDKPHLGHGRVYVTFDLLYRLLTFLGYEVMYVRNFTDIEDKIIAKAEQEGCTHNVIAERYIVDFKKSMDALGCLTPTHEPRVTEYIPEIINFIQKLIEKKHAYILSSDVYFDVTSFPAYGKLSKRTKEDLAAGARVAINEQKRNSEDFALWKGNQNGAFWESPWGHGRPGWHIECSVMASALLGQTIDIHGGGMDLIFPHHENEIAQSEACFGVEFVKCWVHNAFITIHKEKMSKSLGNFVTLEQLSAAYDPMLLRFYFLQHHYRKPIEFAEQELSSAETAYKKICLLMQNLPGLFQKDLNAQHSHAHGVIEMLLEALCDDLNTPKFLGIFFEHLPALAIDAMGLSQVKHIFTDILGLSLEYKSHYRIDDLNFDQEHQQLIQKLLLERERARNEKNWPEADRLREQLRDLGHEVQDKKKV